MKFEGQTIQDSQLSAKLMGALADAEPGTPKLEKMSSLEAFIRKIYAEEIKRKPRLSWGSDIPNAEKVSASWVGKLNKRLSFVGPIGGFYIQNRMILRSNGQECSIDDVPDELHRWTDKQNMVHTAPSDRATVRVAYERHMSAAIAEDPLLCDVCGQVRSENMDQRMAHLYNAHPAEFASKVGLPVVTAVGAVGEETTYTNNVPKIEPEPYEAKCGICGKVCKNQAGLAAHTRFSHPRA